MAKKTSSKKSSKSTAKKSQNNTIHFIVNPVAGSGKPAQYWPQIEAYLKENNIAWELHSTTPEVGATEIAVGLVKKQVYQIVAVGGDGTLSETIQGFFKNGKPVSRNTIFSFVMMGRGNDFRKTFGFSKDVIEMLKHALQGTTKDIDILHLKASNADGSPSERYCLNITSMGMSSEVVLGVNRSKKLGKYIGGKGVFLWESFLALIRYKNIALRIKASGRQDKEKTIRLLVLANGRFAGAGMQFAPKALIDDGKIDVLEIGDVSRIRSLLDTGDLYSGKIIENKRANYYQTKDITIEPVDNKVPIYFECDGEIGGCLPLKIKVLKKTLSLKV